MRSQNAHRIGMLRQRNALRDVARPAKLGRAEGACENVERLGLRKATADRAGNRRPILGADMLHDVAQYVRIMTLRVKPLAGAAKVRALFGAPCWPVAHKLLKIDCGGAVHE